MLPVVRLSASFLLVLIFALLAASVAPVRAQITSQTGAVRLTVADAKGGAVDNAKVTLDSLVSAPVVKETANDGVVVFPLVTPGRYKVTVEQAGFRRSVVDPVLVNVTEVTNLQVTLEVGEVTTEVLVSGEAAPTVNTTNATTGETLAGDVVRNLPLSTRNFLFLLGNNAGTSASLARSG